MTGMNSIHPNAELGEGVNVGHFSVIEEDVVIGEGTEVGHNVTILNGSRIGKNCIIFREQLLARFHKT